MAMGCATDRHMNCHQRVRICHQHPRYDCFNNVLAAQLHTDPGNHSASCPRASGLLGVLLALVILLTIKAGPCSGGG